MDNAPKKHNGSLLKSIGWMMLAAAIVVGDGWLVAFSWARLVRPWIAYELPLSKAICLTMFAMIVKAVAMGRRKDKDDVTFKEAAGYAFAMFALIPLLVWAISAVFAP